MFCGGEVVHQEAPSSAKWWIKRVADYPQDNDLQDNATATLELMLLGFHEWANLLFYKGKSHPLSPYILERMGRCAQKVEEWDMICAASEVGSDMWVIALCQMTERTKHLDPPVKEHWDRIHSWHVRLEGEASWCGATEDIRACYRNLQMSRSIAWEMRCHIRGVIHY
jgi:hypothetical protein